LKIPVVDLKIQIDAKWSLLCLQIGEQIEPQKVELEIQFNGEIRNELEGFYRQIIFLNNLQKKNVLKRL
jgi:hypothetical protein